MNFLGYRTKRKHITDPKYDSTAAYQRHLDSKFRLYGKDRDLAFADAVGSLSLPLFREQGDVHVAVLRHNGLSDGMTVYDIGCGCGRTAQALQRSGWKGSYIGADIIPDFISELCANVRAMTLTFMTNLRFVRMTSPLIASFTGRFLLIFRLKNASCTFGTPSGR